MSLPNNYLSQADTVMVAGRVAYHIHVHCAFRFLSISSPDRLSLLSKPDNSYIPRRDTEGERITMEVNVL